MKRAYVKVACICYLVRCLYQYFSPYDNFELFSDAYRYHHLSDQILKGNFDLDVTAFISAPLYPFTLSLFKLISLSSWEFLAVHFQFFLISLSSVFIYKLSALLFKSRSLAYFSALVYIFYPLTLWFNFTLSQETSFQAYFIIFSFYLIKYFKEKQRASLYKSAFFFSLSILTKSHITLLIPFLFLIFLKEHKLNSFIRFFAVIILLNLPFSIINWNNHQTFTLSSNGAAALFLAGNSAETYTCLNSGLEDQNEIPINGCDLDLIFDPSYEFDKYGKINQLPYSERNTKRINVAFEWIVENPIQFAELKLIGLIRFILPGLDFRIYKGYKFWISFIISFLLYLLAYFYLYKRKKNLNTEDLYFISLLLITAIIFIVFYPQARFRIITLEPYLIVFACKQIWDVVYTKKDATLTAAPH